MKIKKYVWLPAVLAIYLVVMSVTFHETLTVYHDYLRYFGTMALEIVLIVAVYYFLRKRNQLKSEREEDMKRRENSSGDK